jgi:putative lipoic acid-binding regulatory protein
MTPAQQKQLKDKLEEHHTWPSVYMFKFIVKNEGEKVKELLAFFGETAKIEFKESKKGTYKSVTIKEAMLSAEAVVNRYFELNGLEGLISL